MKQEINNTVIKALDPKHGKKIVSWFKRQGWNTEGYDGDCTEEGNSVHIYYGLRDGVFSYWALSHVETYNLKIIQLPSEIKESYSIY